MTTPSSSPAHQPPLELAPLLRRVAGAVGRDPLGQLGVAVARSALTSSAISSTPLRDFMKQIVARALATSSDEQLGRLAQRRAARAERLVEHRRVPHRDLPLRARASRRSSTSANVLQAGQPLGQLDRVGDRRAGQQEARLVP